MSYGASDLMPMVYMCVMLPQNASIPQPLVRDNFPPCLPYNCDTAQLCFPFNVLIIATAWPVKAVGSTTAAALLLSSLACVLLMSYL